MLSPSLYKYHSPLIYTLVRSRSGQAGTVHYETSITTTLDVPSGVLLLLLLYEYRTERRRLFSFFPVCSHLICVLFRGAIKFKIQTR